MQFFTHKKLKITFVALLAFTIAAPAAGAATIQASIKPPFQADLMNTLKLQAGTGNPTFTRATTATVQDWEGLLKPVLSGEARFTGARRVRNYITNSEALNNWSTVGSVSVTTNDTAGPSGTQTAEKIVFGASDGGSRIVSNDSTVTSGTLVTSIWLKGLTGGEQVRLWNGWSAVATVTLTTSWQRYSYSFAGHTQSNFIMINAVSGTPTIYAWGAELENVTGQSNQNPSEYVSCGVLAAPFHGAGTDCVKYFNALNGNTVTSNVVGEASGQKITSATAPAGAAAGAVDATGPLGYLAEYSRTNIALQSQTLDVNGTGAPWNDSGSTVSANAIAAPDGTVTADKVQEDGTSAAHYIYEATTVGAGTATGSVFFKSAERTKAWIYMYNSSTAIAFFDLSAGTIGTVSGSGSPTATITSYPNGWYRVTITATVPSNANLGFGPTTSDGTLSYSGTVGNGIYAWGAQLEAASFASSYIPTTSASVARNADSLNYPASNMSDTAGSVYVETYLNTPASQGNGQLIGQTGGGFGRPYVHSSNVFFIYDGATGSGGATTLSGNTLYKVATKWSTAANSKNIFSNGTAATASTYAGSFGGSGNVSIAPNIFINLRNVKIWKKALTDAQLTTMTSSGINSIAKSVVPQTTIKTPTSTGLVGQWKFDEGTGTKANDSSGLGNFGTLVGSPSWTTGKLGKALNFNGTNSYVDTGALTLPASVSFCAWIKPNVLPGAYKFYVGSDNATGNSGIVIANDSTNHFYIAIKNGYQGNATTITLGSWYHICGTGNTSSGTPLLFINGVQVTSGGSTPISAGTNGGNLYIGSTPRVDNSYFSNAIIDDVRIYNRALSATEISALYKSTAAVVNASTNTSGGSLTSGLVGLWSFDGKDMSWGTGTALDRSGAGNNGSLINMSTSSSPVIGKIGQALKFNGTNNYVTLPDNLIKNNTVISVSLWFKTSSTGGLFGYQDTAIPGASSAYVPLMYVGTDGKLRAEFWQGTPAPITTTGTVNNNAWHHAMLVGNTNTQSLYLDGAFVGNLSGTINQITMSKNQIGAVNSSAWPNGGGNPTYFLGSIDDVRIYNRALSATEVKALYNLGR